MALPTEAQVKPPRRVTAADLRNEIEVYEGRFGMSSEEFQVAFRERRVPETPEFVAWSHAIAALRLASR